MAVNAVVKFTELEAFLLNFFVKVRGRYNFNFVFVL
jgi:hypothetical protein